VNYLDSVIKKYMERLILEYITDRFGKYKTIIQNEHLLLYVDEGYVVGAFLINVKRFHYIRYVERSTMMMFDLTWVQVDEYMKKWIAEKFGYHGFETDAVFAPE
jgi:uncharacterized protein YlbG (UPF0298 family)